mgnify:CR=1 FL=1
MAHLQSKRMVNETRYNAISAPIVDIGFNTKNETPVSNRNSGTNTLEANKRSSNSGKNTDVVINGYVLVLTNMK